MNTPVSFELAKLLKEKKFDEEVSKRWTIVENIDDDKSPFCQHDCGLFNWNNEKYPEYISAPVIADVVMWLYEKHGIWIEVSKLDGYQDLFFHTITGSKGFNFGHKITVVEWDDDKCDEMDYNNKYKDTPTEAYEAAIEYALNNLI